MNNPLLNEWDKELALPPYKDIKDIHFEDAINISMSIQNSKIKKICDQSTSATFSNTIIPLLNSGKKLIEILSIFYSLCATDSNDAREKIRIKVAPKTASHYSHIYQNKKLFLRISTLWKIRQDLELSNEEVRVLFLLRRAFLRSGVDLRTDQKKRFQEIIKELAILGTQFSQNVLKDEKNWFLQLNKEDIFDLPDFLILDLERKAIELGLKGYCINLTESLIMPFLKFSSNRNLRRVVLGAWKGRGLSSKETNNSAIMIKTIELRSEMAKLLGFKTYADYRLETEMAKDPKAVKDLLMNIWNATQKKISYEAEELTRLLNEEGYEGQLEPWDWRHYAEKKRSLKFKFGEEDIKGFFQLDNLINAMFYTVARLFDLECKPKILHSYHPDCKIFSIERKGENLGLFIGDYFARNGKRSGAWCSTLRKQSIMNDVRVSPVVVNVCNFTKPRKGFPCLLSYDEAKTLFHEFGHALHQLLSDVEFEMISGTSVSRDFVELPSQWFEHWLDSEEILSNYAVSISNGTPIPKELMTNLMASKSFNSGFETAEYLSSALVDIEIHSDYLCDDPLRKQKEVLEKIGLHHAILPRHNVEHFAHIFSGDGYASAYYSYIWSEMMDEDAFSAFEETGNIFNPIVAEKFEKNILARGGSDEPERLYRAFRGKLPSIKAIIKSRNLEAFI